MLLCSFVSGPAAQHVLYRYAFTALRLQTAEAAGYDEETIMVGRALQKDFEQRGVHLDAEGQSRASKLTEDIARLGMAICEPTLLH